MIGLWIYELFFPLVFSELSKVFCMMANQNTMPHMNLGLICLYWIFYYQEPNVSTLVEMYGNKVIKMIGDGNFVSGISQTKTVL